MRSQSVRFFLFVFVLMFTVALALPAAAQTDPQAVAEALIAAEGANNVDAAAALFADDAVVTLADGSTYDTPEGVRAWQQALADGHFRLEPVGISVDGSTVAWTGNISLDAFRSLGIASMGGIWTLDIEDGKVKTFDFQFTPDAITALVTGSTVAALVDDEAKGDVDAAVALFADDAVVTLADGSSYDTPEGVRAWQQALADGHFRLEPVARYVHGNMVTMNGEIALDAFRGMGIPSLGGVWNVTVDGGKITSFDFQFTPEAVALLTATPEP